MEGQDLSNEVIIERTIEFVKKTLSGAESGHDWQHINRVWGISKKITANELKENKHINYLVVELAALLHDIADWKFAPNNCEK